MMKKTIYLFLISILISTGIKAIENEGSALANQTTITKNMIYGEANLWIMGSAANVSYERILHTGEKGYFSAAGSYGLWKDEYENGDLISLTGNYLYGTGSHQIEFGLGGMIKVHYDQYFTNEKKFDHVTLLPDLFLGYRYKKPAGHLIFKAGVGFPGLVSAGVGVAF